MKKILLSSALLCVVMSSFGQWLTTGTPNTANLYTNGNVGIGTTDPVVKLQVEVNSAITDYSQLPGSFFMRNTSTTNGSLNGLSFGDANRWGVAGIASQLINPGSHTANLSFWTRKNGAAPAPQMLLDENGNLSIGTTNSQGYKLAVKGKAVAEEMNVKLQANWPDYVFEKDYALLSLESVQSYISQNKHLPEVPSAKEMEANGINLSEMNMLLLKKVEELTLYVIQQNKIIQTQGDRIEKLEKDKH